MAIGMLSGAILLSGLPHAGGQVRTKKVGNPTWEPVDFHIFSGPIGTFDDGFAEFGQNLCGLLPPPNHSCSLYMCATNPGGFGAGPDAPHAGYETEMASGVKNLGFVEKTSFQISEFSIPRGVYAVWMIVAGPDSPKGSSPDFDNGPIIPNSICPITTHGETFRNRQVFNPFLGDIVVPPIDQFPCHPWAVDGHSHIPIFYADTKEFGTPDINPA